MSLGQYENLVRSVRPLMEDNDTTESFWLRIHNTKVGNDFKYRFLSTGVIKMMCLPLSNAEVERTFSATSHIKWWRRAKMETDLLENCMYCMDILNIVLFYLHNLSNIKYIYLLMFISVLR